MLASKLFCKFTLNFGLLARASTTSNVSFMDNFHIELNTKFTNVEKEKILNTLNTSGSPQLTGIVSNSRIKTLETYKQKNGLFRDLSDILDVDGFGVKNAEQLCKKIISTDTLVGIKETTLNGNRRIKQFVTPPLPPVKDISNIVGIHVAPSGVSWAKLSHQNNRLHVWGYQNLTILPKKILPVDTFKIALNIVNELPEGDLYVLEGNSAISPQGPKPSSAVASYTQHQELIAMLLALINTSPDHNVETEDNGWVNKVFFIRSKTPARLFKTLVGNECVSSDSTVCQLIEESPVTSLPCTPIKLDTGLKHNYLEQAPSNKELLGQALMIAVSFVELFIKKNPTSLSALISNKKML